MARELRVTIVGDSSSLEKALSRSTKQTSGFERGLKQASFVAVGAFAGIGLAAKVGFAEISEGQKVSAQTEAALKSTGGVANVTAGQIAGLASQLSKLTGIDDEAIQANSNLLLTFKAVANQVGKGNDIFDRATKASLDLSVAGFGSLDSTAKSLGKALNDPLRGMSALGRAGVTFTASQRDTIRALVESGKTLEAQKIILGEVESQVGGSAKAYGETLPGQMAKAKNAMTEMSASLTTALLPAMTALAGVASAVAVVMTEHSTAAKVAIGAIAALAGIVLATSVAVKLYATYQALAAAATVAWTGVQWALNAALTANPVGVVVVALAALVGGLILAYKHSETFRRIVDAAFKVVKAAAEAVLGFFRDHWKTIAVLISGPFAPLVLLATDAFGIRSKLLAAANAVMDFFRSNWKTIAVLISGPFAPLVALATDAFGVRSRLVNAFAEIAQAVREKVGALVELVRGIPGRIVSALGNLRGLLYNAGVSIIQGLIDGITAKLGELWGLAGSIASGITSRKGPIEKDRKLLEPQGRAIIEGLMSGMQSALPGLESMVSSIAPSIGKGIRGLEGLRGASELPGVVLPPPDVVPTTDALGVVIKSVDAATSHVVTFRDLISSLPGITTQAFTDVAKLILKAIAPLAKALEPPRAAIQDVADALHAIGRAAYATRAALQDTVDDILRLLAKTGGATGLGIPGRAHGGQVRAGSAYVVGEAGPELFIPQQSGTVLSNTESMAAGTALAGGDTHFTSRITSALVRS
jgi:hypothetical protein